MGYKSITKYLDVPHYLQTDSDWKSCVLTGTVNGVYKTSTIGAIGCAMTSGAMVAGITPGVLWESYNMKDYICNWSKIPTHTFSWFSASSDANYAAKFFSEIVLNNNPVIVYGDDGTTSEFSSHFAVVYGFVGTVAVDAAGGYSLTSYDLNQFKVYDPSDKLGYGNHTNVNSFNDRFPIESLRLTKPK